MKEKRYRYYKSGAAIIFYFYEEKNGVVVLTCPRFICHGEF